jgi:flagellar basal body-associated protein FliL
MDKKPNAPETPETGDSQTKLILYLILGIALAAPLLSMVLTVNMVNSKLETLKLPKAGATENAEGTPTEKPSAPVLAFYDPLEFLVNLADVADSHYLRATISLALPMSALAGGGAESHGEHGGKASPLTQKLKPQEPVIRDTIIAVISSKQFKELATPAGKNELKEAIRTRLQEQLGLTDLAIYFTAFTLQ